MKFETLSLDQYQQLRLGAEVIEADAFGDKVLRLSDQSYFKLFRRKRLFSSATLKPYSQRFAENAEKLISLGIPTVKMLALYKIPEIKRTAVHYAALEGETLRHLAHSISSEEKPALAKQLKNFIDELHQKGVYFRSLHLGNIILTPEGSLGLIDIADMKFFNRPLSSQEQVRNKKHLSRYPEDCEQLPGLPF